MTIFQEKWTHGELKARISGDDSKEVLSVS